MSALHDLLALLRVPPEVCRLMDGIVEIDQFSDAVRRVLRFSPEGTFGRELSRLDHDRRVLVDRATPMLAESIAELLRDEGEETHEEASAPETQP
jgi:hypothetical protein